MATNTTPKIKINYARKSGRSSNRELINTTDDGLITEKEAALGREKAMQGDKHELQKIRKSKRRTILAADDDRFMNWLEEHYGKDLVSNYKIVADIYSNEFNELDEKIQTHAAEQAIKYERNKDVLTSLAKGMESPAQEIFSSIMEALATASKENSLLHDKMDYMKERLSWDELNEFSPDEALFFTKAVPPNKLADIVGDEMYKRITDSATNSDQGITPNSSIDEDEELEKNKRPEESQYNKIKDNLYYVYTDDKDLIFKSGPYEKKLTSEDLKKLAPDGKIKITKGDTYKRNLKKSKSSNSLFCSSHTPKLRHETPNYTVVKCYNLFSKISEFIQERFPKNFSHLDGKKIYLNDGRYLKAKLVNELNFSVTSYVKDVKQFSVVLPLKVHKFKWMNSIKDEIINKR